MPLLLIVPLTGCNRSGDDAAVTAGDTEAASDGESRTMQLTEAGRERAGTTPPPARDGATATPPPADAPDLAIDPRDAAFAAHRLSAAPRYPEDFVIGSLRTSGLSSTLLAAREHAALLLRSLLQDPELPADESAGEPPSGQAPNGEAAFEDLLLDPGPGARSQLAEVLAAVDALDLTADRLRLGRPQPLTDEEVSVAFRVLGEAESLRGELILEMADGRWYTADIQVTRSSMGSARVFEPGLDRPRL
jgi:hypothetical protein